MAVRPAIYFAASIRGGSGDAALYADLIAKLKERGNVLSEHFFGPPPETPMTDAEIYQRDLAMLREASVVIAEVTQPSLGVGYEIGLAEALGKPVIALFRPSSGKTLSAMIRGNSGVAAHDYATVDEAMAVVDTALAALADLPKHKTPVESFLVLSSM